MSEYRSKLEAIAVKKQKLLNEELKLIEKRKKEIAASAERFGLLTVSDEFMTGLFIEAANFIKQHPDKTKKLEEEGYRFLNSKKQNTKAA